MIPYIQRLWTYLVRMFALSHIRLVHVTANQGRILPAHVNYMNRNAGPLHHRNHSIQNFWNPVSLCVTGPPGFLKKPDAERFASVGDSVEFSCMASGAPPFMISWSKEEDEVDDLFVENEIFFIFYLVLTFNTLWEVDIF